jgi:hypothetical protein
MKDQDLLDIIEDNGETFNNKNDNKSYNKDKDKPKNMWDVTNIDSIEIDVEKFDTSKKTFTIYCFSKDNFKDDFDKYKAKLINISKALVSRDYVYRHTGSSDDKIANDVLAIENIKIESYLPFKKFNSNIEKPIIYRPFEIAYRIAYSNYKNFLKKTPAIRSFISRDVHSILGKDCKQPSSLLLLYTKCGSETLKGLKDFSTLEGNAYFMLKLSEKCNIPVFNIKNDDVVKRLSEFLNNK